MLDKVTVVGAGSWGTTVAAIAARSVPTTLWARRAELAAAVDRSHENPDYLPGARLPARLRATASLPEAVRDASLVVMAVPSHGFRACSRNSPPPWSRERPCSAWPRGSRPARTSG